MIGLKAIEVLDTIENLQKDLSTHTRRADDFRDNLHWCVEHAGAHIGYAQVATHNNNYDLAVKHTEAAKAWLHLQDMYMHDAGANLFSKVTTEERARVEKASLALGVNLYD